MRKATVKNHLSDSEINDILKDTREPYELHRRLLFIRKVKDGNKITKVSEEFNISRKTGERWIRNYNENGLEGLNLKYKNCGRKSKLDEGELMILDDIINKKNVEYKVSDVQDLIYDLFGVKFSYKHTGHIMNNVLNYKNPD